MPELPDFGNGDGGEDCMVIITDEGDPNDDQYTLKDVINVRTFKDVIQKISECGMEYKNYKYDMDDKTRLVPGNEIAQGIILELINNGENISKIDLDKIIDNDPIKVKNLLNLFNERKKKGKLTKFKTNWENLFNDILKLKDSNNGETVVDNFMSYRLRGIKFKNAHKTDFFNELYEYNLKIWKILYNNSFDGQESLKKESKIPKLPSRQYLWHKFEIYGENIAYDNKEKKIDDLDEKINLFVCLRNFQLIVINSIYNIIDSFYVSSSLLHDDLDVKLNTTINKLYDLFELTETHKKILEFSKIKYKYINFETYIKTIYKNLICDKFRQIENYSKFNVFTSALIINYLMIKNKIFLRGGVKLEWKNYVSNDTPPTENDEKIIQYINNINAKCDDINNFIKILTELDEKNAEQSPEQKSIGKRLLGDEKMEDTKYELELRKMFFYANLYVDEALRILYKDMTKDFSKVHIDNDSIIKNFFYVMLKTKIVRTPALVLDDDHNLLCKALKINKVSLEEITKVIGLRKNLGPLRDACPELFEASDYLSTSHPVSFMLLYWSNTMNTVLMSKAIRDDKYVLLLIDEDYLPYHKYVGADRHKQQNIHRNVLKLMGTKLYVGYLKFNLYDYDVIRQVWNRVMNIVLVFFNNYSFEFYDIYGSPVSIGDIYARGFITANEIMILKSGYEESKEAYFDVERAIKNKTEKTYHIYWIDPIKTDDIINRIKKTMLNVTRLFSRKLPRRPTVSDTPEYHKLYEILTTDGHPTHTYLTQIRDLYSQPGLDKTEIHKQLKFKDDTPKYIAPSLRKTAEYPTHTYLKEISDLYSHPDLDKTKIKDDTPIYRAHLLSSIVGGSYNLYLSNKQNHNNLKKLLY